MVLGKVALSALLCKLTKGLRVIIIIMYIYHALINALSTHIIHINLNMIVYTHVEHSPIKNNLYKVLYGNTHTQTPQ